MEAKVKIRIDLQKENFYKEVQAMQGDGNTRVVEIILLSDSTPWEPPADAEIAISYRQPDGHKGLYNKLSDDSPAITVNKNVVSAVLAPQMLTIPGIVNAALVFFDSRLNQLTTLPFNVSVKENPAIGSQETTDYIRLQWLEDKLEEYWQPVREQIGAAVEGVAVREQVNQLKNDLAYLAPTIVCDACGDVMTLDDSNDRPFCGLNLYGKTTQNGTPSTDAPVELVSVGESVNVTVCGNNLLNTKTITNHYYTADGVMTANASFALFDWIPVKQGENLALSAKYIGSIKELLRWAFFDKKKNFISRHTSAEAKAEESVITVPADGYIRIFLNADNYDITTAQLTYGGTVSEFEAFDGGTVTVSTPNGLPGIPVTSGGNYTDGEGQQWICDEVDFERGVYVRRCGVHVFDVGDGWVQYATQNTDLIQRYGTQILYGKQKAVDNGWISNAMCSIAMPISANAGYEGTRIGFSVNGDGVTSFYLPSADFPDVNSWTAYLQANPVSYVYELKTPIETAMPDDVLAAYAALRTYAPTTNISNDAGAWMEVAYQADTKRYIDKQFAELRNAIVSLGGNV